MLWQCGMRSNHPHATMCPFHQVKQQDTNHFVTPLSKLYIIDEDEWKYWKEIYARKLWLLAIGITDKYSILQTADNTDVCKQ